jgi:RNA polymerase sigma factor (sigma-70 family)
MPDSSAQSRPDYPARFCTTHWSVVSLAGEAESPHAGAALEKLCAGYWYPIYAEIRRRGHSSPDAQDLTQEFFASLLRRQSFAGADKNKGRFRSFILGALTYFLIDHLEHKSALKRGGHCEILSLDTEEAEQLLEHENLRTEPAERQFDRRWAITLLDQAFRRLQEEFARDRKDSVFAAVKPFLAHETGSNEYHAPAAQLGVSPGAFAVTVHRVRGRFRDILRAEVANTLVNPADVDDELRHLFS